MPNCCPLPVRLTLECVGNSDALYHNVEHTMLVTLVGHDILVGRVLDSDHHGYGLCELRFWPVSPTTSATYVASSRVTRMTRMLSSAIPAAIARGVGASVHLAYAGFLRLGEPALLEVPARRARAIGLERAAFVDRKGSVGV